MRKKSSIQLLCFLLVTEVAGCRLEAPREVGDKCDGASYVYLGRTGERVLKGDNADYDLFLNANFCPPNAPYCRVRVSETGTSIVEQVSEQTIYCSDRQESCENDAHTWNAGEQVICEADRTLHCCSNENN